MGQPDPIQVHEDGSGPHYHDQPQGSSSSTSPIPNGTAIDIRSYHFDSLPTPTSPPWISKVADRIPSPVKRVSKVVTTWVKGPQPPRPYRIDPFFPNVQTAPVRLLDRYIPKRSHRIWLLLALYFCWILAFATVLHKSAFASDVPGYGAPTRLSCTARYWSDGNGCGINGDGCRPFDNSSLAFRCPANCLPTSVLNPHAVGDQEVNYRPLVIGGPTDASKSLSSTNYRGDSFVCSSAIHAGFISNKDGGCGVLALVGEKSGYPAVDQYSIASVGFDSYFPQSFTFAEGSASECRDLRWPLLAVSVIFTSLLSVFTTSAALFFGTIFTALFFHVGLASDPPSNSDYYSIVSITLGRFLPAAFCAFAIYRYVIKRTFTQPKLLDAQIEKTVLWLGAAWVGALNNYTFDKIPIQRLTPHDLRQPGAITALVIIALAILLIALGQVWALRVEGRMPRYLALYVLFGALLGLLVAIPNMNVRIHHYILALLLLPGTSLQNRPSLLYQGLLVGLFINGVARWGFDSILQTPAMLLGDGQLGTLLPQLAAPVIGVRNITFAWQGFPDGWDGISVLVNDVERFRGYEDFGAESFTWERRREGLSEYFRFAFMSGSQVGDYTRAGIWAGNGSWVEMLPGPSR